MDSLQTQRFLTNRKELELRSKSSLLHSQRILLEHNFEAVTDRQLHLTAKETHLSASQHQLVTKLAEIQQGEVVVAHKERVFEKRKEILTGKIEEMRANRGKIDAVTQTIVERLRKAEVLMKQLQKEEQELNTRQLLVSHQEAHFASLSAHLAQSKQDLSPQWHQYEAYQHYLTSIQGCKGLLRLKNDLKHKEITLNQLVSEFKENQFQLLTLKNEIKMQEMEMKSVQKETEMRVLKGNEKRNQLEIAQKRYENAKNQLQMYKNQKSEPEFRDFNLEAELTQLKSSNFDLQAAISRLQTDQTCLQTAMNSLKSSLPLHESELSTRLTLLAANKATLQGIKRRVLDLEWEVTQLTELESCMETEVQRRLYGEAEGKEKYGELRKQVRDTEERIENKENALRKRIKNGHKVHFRV